MTLTVLGLNHNSAPLAVRERLAHNAEQVAVRLKQLKAVDGIDEIALLSTCNRTEFYASQSHAQSLKQWFWEQSFDDIQWKQHMYEHHEADAVHHLFRVACGLDSLVLGEPQILGQLKDAYQIAKDNQTIGTTLTKAFESAFSVAKKVRNQTRIGQDSVSVAASAVKLSHSIFGELSDSQALLIGAGETIDITAKHLAQKGIQHIIIANRRVEKAKHLAEQYNGTGIGISDIPQALLSADIVVSSTASTLPLIGKGMIETALKKRKHQPYFMVDLAVPRDIEPEVGELDDVYLFTLDDLQKTIEQNQKNRQAAGEEAEAIVHLETVAYMDGMRALDAKDTLQSIHQMTNDIRQDTLNKALQMLNNGKPPEEALQFLAHSLSKKLMHQPSVQLRDAATEGDLSLLKAAHILFNLKH